MNEKKPEEIILEKLNNPQHPQTSLSQHRY